MEVSLIFPHQLYQRNPALKKGVKVWLIEDDLFFGQYSFHKKKILLHRASMKYYEDLLRKKGFEVKYIDWMGPQTLSKVFQALHQKDVKVVHYTDPVDYLLQRRLNRYLNRYDMKAIRYESPNFIFNHSFADSIFQTDKAYFQTRFYQHARKVTGILTDHGRPSGGKWTFDKENRKPLPAHLSVPAIPMFTESTFLTEARRYVNTRFANNPGTTHNFAYAVTHANAQSMLENFLQYRLQNFGPYQDAIHIHEPFLFHSVLSPALNIGLIDPENVIKQVIDYAQTYSVALPSLEGFIRQILGWREFIRAVYMREGVKQRTSNYFNNQASMPALFYNASTGILPLDRTIVRVNMHAYAHHIERLMVLGNFMLLCEIHPNHVYQWFMEMFIDAYDWVMVPNVYGMSQYADGGLMSTKPYISSSNYILKMSGYKKELWCDIWDGLYWRFIDRHEKLFSNNPRMRLMAELGKKIPGHKKIRLFRTADDFLKKIHT